MSLKKLREERGLSAQDVAKEVRVTRQTIYNAEAGQLSIELLAKLANFYDVPTDEILGRKKD